MIVYYCGCGQDIELDFDCIEDAPAVLRCPHCLEWDATPVFVETHPKEVRTSND